MGFCASQEFIFAIKYKNITNCRESSSFLLLYYVVFSPVIYLMFKHVSWIFQTILNKYVKYWNITYIKLTCFHSIPIFVTFDISFYTFNFLPYCYLTWSEKRTLAWQKGNPDLPQKSYNLLLLNMLIINDERMIKIPYLKKV